MEEISETRKKLPKPTSNNVARARRLRKEMSLPEVLIWIRLRPKVNKTFVLRRQVPLLQRYVVDFYFAPLKIAFEIDGQIHALKVDRDAERDRQLAEAGISVVRIGAHRVLKSPDEVSSFIRQICLQEVTLEDLE